MDPTAAAYQGLPKVDKAFYDSIRIAKARKLVESFVVPIRSGQAWKVQRPASKISLTVRFPPGVYAESQLSMVPR